MQNEFFEFSSLLKLISATAIVGVVTNTLRRVLKLRHPVVPFSVSILVIFAGAAATNALVSWPNYLVAFFNACLLFCTATGAQEAITEGLQPKPRSKDELQSGKPVRWWSSWLRD